MRKGRRSVPIVSWLPVLAVGLVASIGQAALTGRRVSPDPLNRPVQAQANGYVGSSRCLACHPSQYASWHASYHRTMTTVATPATIAGTVDGTPLAIGGFEYRLEAEGGSIFARKRPAGAATGAADTRQQVVLLTGSHHQQNLWLENGNSRTVEPFPFAWLVAEKRWVPGQDTFLAPPDLGETHAAGSWNTLCINCHTTNGRMRQFAAAGFDSQVADFGIACEACHGPGEAHVSANRNPIRRYALHMTGKPDPTIANPARMTARAASLTCGQCHSVWDFDQTKDLRKWNEEGTAFRPGQPDLAERKPVHESLGDGVASFWPDGMVRITGWEFNGVEASPCFAGGKFSCLSCHEMHPDRTDKATLADWAPGQMKKADSANQSCLQCHPKIGEKLTEHTHHAAGSSGSECYNCHMPYSSYGLLGAVRSHKVSSPSAQESLQAGRPNACVLCHLDKPLAWSAEKLSTWYGIAAPAMGPDDRNISAAVQWILKGDAGQRALIAWSMGWAAAQQASGRDWLAPYLAVSLNDAYSAVRFIAGKSLRTLPGFERLAFDHTAPEAVTFRQGNDAYLQFVQQPHPAKALPTGVLLDANGRFDPVNYMRLIDQRDNRRIYLVE